MVAKTNNKNPWRGVFPAVTTQFRPDQSLDLAALSQHLNILLASGVQGLVMLGSLGENLALTAAEKILVVKTALAVAAGRVPVIAGVIETSTAAACRYAEVMQQLGAAGLMVLPAMVYRADPRETLSHYRAVARASALPIICYNNPLAYHVDITPAMFAELADEPRFVAIKESSGDVRRITDLRNLVGDRFSIFCGVDDLLMEAVTLGADGWIAGMNLAYPAEGQLLWELLQGGAACRERALELYRWFTPLLHLDVPVKFVQYIKYVSSVRGFGSEWVRAPRLPLIGAERAWVRGIVAAAERSRPKWLQT